MAVGWFEDETAVVAAGPGEWSADLTDAWNIGDNANGGYAAAPLVRAMAGTSDHPDPISVTTHFLRPVDSAGRATLHTGLARSGRRTAMVTGSLSLDGRERLTALAAFGDLGASMGADDELGPPPPDIPDPARCVDRSELHQGVTLSILERVDVVLDPACAVPAGSRDAVVTGWVRFGDGGPTSALALPVFADVFPPALYPLLGRVGWMPTVELTVHVRRRPVDGWVLARFECDDLVGGRMIETGTLWDSSGTVVARSRQLGLVLMD